MGRASALEYVKYGVLGWLGMGTGIALPTTHPATHTPGTPLPPAGSVPGTALSAPQYKGGRGALIGSSTHFKGPFLRLKGYYRGL